MEIELKIQLGDCGMGMPVIRTWQAMKKLAGRFCKLAVPIPELSQI